MFNFLTKFSFNENCVCTLYCPIALYTRLETFNLMSYFFARVITIVICVPLSVVNESRWCDVTNRPLNANVDRLLKFEPHLNNVFFCQSKPVIAIKSDNYSE